MCWIVHVCNNALTNEHHSLWCLFSHCNETLSVTDLKSLTVCPPKVQSFKTPAKPDVVQKTSAKLLIEKHIQLYSSIQAVNEKVLMNRAMPKMYIVWVREEGLERLNRRRGCRLLCMCVLLRTHAWKCVWACTYNPVIQPVIYYPWPWTGLYNFLILPNTLWR